MAARQGPNIFSMKREKKVRDRGWEGLEGEQPSMGVWVKGGGGMETGQEAGPGRLASNYINSA